MQADGWVIYSTGAIFFDRGAITSDGSGVISLNGINYTPMTTTDINAISPRVTATGSTTTITDSTATINS